MGTIYLVSILMVASSLVGAQTKKVIFVCEHGAAKSFIAAKYFNKLARENNLNWKAECRATAPDSALTDGTRKGLKSDRIYDPKRVPLKIDYSDTVTAQKIILFTKLPAEWRTDIDVQDWSTTPNIDGTYEQRRDAIIKKLMELISTLE